MRAGASQFELSKVADKLRSDASARARTADFIFRVFLALLLTGGGVLLLAAVMFGACAAINVIVHFISLIPAHLIRGH